MIINVWDDHKYDDIDNLAYFLYEISYKQPDTMFDYGGLSVPGLHIAKDLRSVGL